MPRVYKREETIDAVTEDSKKPVQLYKAGYINRKGKTSDTKEYYSEVISEYLLNNGIVDEMSKIKSLNRKDYQVLSHQEILRSNTNRKEENFAKSLFGLRINGLGDIIDYQVPLKKIQTNKAGKIDLITYKEDKPKTAYIIELKYEGNIETLLRAVLEIATYYEQLNMANFINSFNKYKNLNDENIKKAVLLTKGCNAYSEAKDLDNRPQLNELIRKLDVEVFFLPLEVERII